MKLHNRLLAELRTSSHGPSKASSEKEEL